MLRPRLYEPEPDLAKVELSRILEPIRVGHLRAAVSTIDTDRRVVVADGEEIGYDRTPPRDDGDGGRRRIRCPVRRHQGRGGRGGLVRGNEGQRAHAEGKEVKKRINQHIHPPVDDAQKILAAADRVYIELPFFLRRDDSARGHGRMIA